MAARQQPQFWPHPLFFQCVIVFFKFSFHPNSLIHGSLSPCSVSPSLLYSSRTPGQHQPKLTVLAHSPWLPYSTLILSLHVNRAPESASLHFSFVGAHIPCHSVFSVVYCRVQLPTLREPNDSSSVAASNKRSRRKMNSQVA